MVPIIGSVFIILLFLFMDKNRTKEMVKVTNKSTFVE